LPRPYRVIAYPVLPVAFAAAAFMIIVNSLTTQPKECGFGLAIVLVGIPVYYYWTRSRRTIQSR
jgi:basic amino acid/polyamine antiporter, APA family